LLPAASFRETALRCSKAPPAGYPAQDRHLETAFRSLATTARVQTTIAKSVFPACLFDASLSLCRNRSAYNSSACTGSPRHRRDQYCKPVSRLQPGDPNLSSGLRSPLGLLGPLQIRAFNPIPYREARLLSHPISLCSPQPFLFKVLVTDQRSESATSLQACCSSNLLEPHS
jgi:hypothetical protein